MGEADALLIVPPFATVTRPYLSAHILQACGREKGFTVDVLYANLLFAEMIGSERYLNLAYEGNSLLTEMVFAPRAFEQSVVASENETVKELLPIVDQLVDIVASVIAQREYMVVGSSSTFFQTTSSVALLSAVKKLDPEVITIVGGANCRAEMAEGMATLSPLIDYVFSGECEDVFPKFLQDVAEGNLPSEKIIDGSYRTNMNEIPTPDYSEYYEQLEVILPGVEFDDAYAGYMPYETSRGCWWGQKHHCRFCGNNDGRGSMNFRAKSPSRVMEELQELLAKHPTKRIHMADNAMPYEYFDTLLPTIAEELPGLSIFYSQKANISFEKVRRLAKAGVKDLQVGVEAISTPLLTLLNKGIKARANINLLRYLRMMDIYAGYLLLYGVPNDTKPPYEQTMDLIPLIRHLGPPIGFRCVDILRFSPYYQETEKFKITNIRPTEAYRYIFPEDAELEKLAFSFDADFQSEALANVDLLNKVDKEIDEWKKLWATKDPNELPKLHISRSSNGQYELADTRLIANTRESSLLNLQEATFALDGCPMTETKKLSKSDKEALSRCLDLKLVTELDGWYTPLATADEELYLEFQ